jgi:hypothetical protein
LIVRTASSSPSLEDVDRTGWYSSSALRNQLNMPREEKCE